LLQALNIAMSQIVPQIREQKTADQLFRAGN